MKGIIIANRNSIEPNIVTRFDNTVCSKPISSASVPINKCSAAFFELDPGNTANAYHYHEANEEVFYIISGSGVLRHPEGETPISAGDAIVCSATPEGAHLLKNTSDTEKLIYINFATSLTPDIMYTPDNNGGIIFSQEGGITFERGGLMSSGPMKR